MAKFGTVILMLGIFKVNCYAINLYGIPSASFSLQSSIGVQESNKNSVRVTRQTLGYQSQVQPRDQTVIVVPNAGSRGVPTSYGANSGQTVVVVPNDNYSRRYIAKSRMNHHR